MAKKLIFVDATETPEGVFYGAVVWIDPPRKIRQQTSFVISDHLRSTNRAEVMAIRVAKKMYPGELIHCDNIAAAITESVTYANRKGNPAHAACRLQKGFTDKTSCELIAGKSPHHRPQPWQMISPTRYSLKLIGRHQC